ncbi:chorismate mutase [Acinetobacter shaoyimingii]|uniref:chorismate mutase n=1 Tax=Acinetobacter shaoyimingii TaxID=2715164 RepID=A0A6G8RRR2_9GAMM|nr:chorismate mutase [Acinetobacter shaoyimingii]NHB59538.1 chorismate mutase [Acinetobacter shaoyimingii]QIO04510.1 chorismate mutase [Acinetobacter shaoyimingii]
MNKEKCSSLEEVRNHIDRIDQSLIELLATRQYYVDQAVRFKHSVQDVQSPQRVEQVIAKVRAQATEARIDPDLIEKLYRDMLQHFIQRELKEIRP